jgi:phosphatidyl-myo-inositol dimannoside synthase
MRVLFLTPDIFRQSGGIARYCRLACKALGDAPQVGRVDVVSLHDPVGGAADARYLPPGRGEFFAAGGSVPRFIALTLRLAATRRYDVLLTGHVNFATLLLGCRAAAPGAAVVAVAHGIEVWARRPWLRRVGMTGADQVVCVSGFTRDKMIAANGVAPERARVLHNCFDPHLEGRAGGDAARLRLEHPSLLTVSRVSREDRHKGHERVLRALVRVRRDVPGVRYYVVGEGDLVPELRRTAAELGLEGDVRFLGFVSDEELSAAYRQCDLFVMPSHAEGFGYVFAEAMAYGKAVVAGNRDATVEVVRDGETGLLVDPGDDEELARAITRLLADAELREGMGRRGAEVVAAEFGFEKFRRTLLEHLEDAVERRRGAAGVVRRAARGES